MKVSSIDFVGLGFADKKSTRGLPPGLVPVEDYFPGGDLPEVEFIVGDKTRFDKTEKELDQEGNENSDVYKPKVSTWGVFPRPRNISKTVCDYYAHRGLLCPMLSLEILCYLVYRSV